MGAAAAATASDVAGKGTRPQQTLMSKKKQGTKQKWVK
jgi:thiamine monophosphate kinase